MQRNSTPRHDYDKTCMPLWDPGEKLLKAACNCSRTDLGYIKALYETLAWPFDPVWPKESVTEILSRLDGFSYQPLSSACRDCRQNYESIVKDAVK